MGIQTFEMFHGAVLAKITRRSEAVVLRLIETRPEEYWSVYTINDAVHLVVKYRTRPRPLKNGRLAWSFIFSSDELERIRVLSAEKEVSIALVGGQQQIGAVMEIGLLTGQELMRMTDPLEDGLSITLRYEPGKQLRIFHKRRLAYKVPRNRMDTWNIPGS